MLSEIYSIDNCNLCSFALKGDTAVVGHTSGPIHIVDLNQRTRVAVPGLGLQPSTVAVRTGDNFLVGDGRGNLCVYRNVQRLAKLAIHENGFAFSVDPHHDRVLTSSYDGTSKLLRWDSTVISSVDYAAESCMFYNASLYLMAARTLWAVSLPAFETIWERRFDFEIADFSIIAERDFLIRKVARQFEHRTGTLLRVQGDRSYTVSKDVSCFLVYRHRLVFAFSPSGLCRAYSIADNTLVNSMELETPIVECISNCSTGVVSLRTNKNTIRFMTVEDV